MALTPDEQRALDWQASQKRGVAFQRSLQALLKGSSTAYASLVDKTKALKRGN